MSTPLSRFPGLVSVLAACLIGTLSPTTHAQVDKFGLQNIPGLEPAPVEPVTVSVVVASDTVAPEGKNVLAITLAHAPGWHSHTESPAPPDSWGFTAVPTTVEVDAPEGTLIGRVQWPTPHVITADLGGTGVPEEYAVFDGNAVIFVPFQLAPDAPAQVELTVRVGYQACDDKMCERPQNEAHAVSLTVDADAAALDLETGPFAAFDAGPGFDSLAAPAPPATDPVDAGTAPAGDAEGWTPPVETQSIVVLTLLAIVGGFVLNLTPCVLPVIPIKVMTLIKHAGESRARAIVLGLWMAFGVVAFWLAIGTPMAFVSSSLDPSRLLFGNWWVTLLLGLVIAGLGVGIMGMFTINLPQAAYAINPKADTPHGSFLFGVMTAVLGLPCFGFVAGALLAGAATMSAFEILAIFGGLGVGMAAPYLVLAAFPNLVSRLPRTGPASELVKQVMGLLMFAAAAYFVAVGLYTLVVERPWMATNMKWWGATAFVALAGFWLIFRTFQISKGAAPRVVFSALALLGVVGSGWFAASSTAYSKAQHDLVAGVEQTSDYVFGAWNRYTPGRFQKAVDDGKVVVIDFTAEWCLNCKAYKRAVLDQDPVRSRLAQDDVVMFTGDITSASDPANDLMEELGETGIPLLIIQGPGVTEPMRSSAASGDEIVRRVDLAASPSIESARR